MIQKMKVLNQQSMLLCRPATTQRSSLLLKGCKLDKNLREKVSSRKQVTAFQAELKCNLITNSDMNHPGHSAEPLYCMFLIYVQNFSDWTHSDQKFERLLMNIATGFFEFRNFMLKK